MNKLRRNQLDSITEKYKNCTNGVKIVLLKGEAGIGKSYLIDKFVESISDDEVIVSRGHCNYQTGKYEPYLPFKELLKDLVDLKKYEAKSSEKNKGLNNFFHKSVNLLIDVAPDLIDTFVPSGNIINKLGKSVIKGLNLKEIIETRLKARKVNENFKIDESQVHKQYIDFVKRLSSERRIVIVLEDLQWLDETSVNLFLPLIQKLENSEVLILGSYRSNEVNDKSYLFSVLNEVKRNFGNIELDLDLKDDEDKQIIMNSILDEVENDLSTEFRNKMLSITNGNPLFISELMSSLKQSNQVCVDEHGVMHSNADLDWSTIPVKLEAVVLGRLSKLEEDTKSLLSSASVQGSSFLMQILSKIEGLNDRELMRMFARTLIKEHKLLKEGKVQRIKGKVLSYFHFSNGLIQHYLYNSLMMSERMFYHQDIAETLEEMYAEELTEVNGLIAYHYEKAEIFDKAVQYYESVGKDSVKVSAFNEASMLFEKALKMLEIVLPEDEDKWLTVKLRLLVQLSMALKPLKGWNNEQVVDLYNEAYNLGVKLNAYDVIAPVTFGKWASHLLHMDFDKAFESANSYQDIALKLDNDDMKLEAKISICNTLFWMGEHEKSLTLTDQVLQEFNPEVHGSHIYKYGQDPRSFAYMFKALNLSLLKKTDEAFNTAEEAINWAKELNHPFTYAIVLQLMTWLYFQENDLQKSNSYALELIEFCEKNEFHFYLGVGYLFASSLYIQNKEFEKAEVSINKGYNEIIGKNGSKIFHSVYILLKASLEAGKSEFSDAASTLKNAIAYSEEKKELVYINLLKNELQKVESIACSV